MGVNDRPNEMEVMDENTTKAFKAYKFTIAMVIYRDRFIFLMSLNFGGKTLLTLFYFLTSINSVVKLLDSWSNLIFYFY